MMTRLAIAGYRSLRDIRVSLAALNVVTGADGSGKSSLYRALRLLADIAQGRIIKSLAGDNHCSDPRETVDLLVLREPMREWRFYDHLRTDRDAPARKPQTGTYTPVLAGDGSDLAATVATIRKIGAGDEMDNAIAD